MDISRHDGKYTFKALPSMGRNPNRVFTLDHDKELLFLRVMNRRLEEAKWEMERSTSDGELKDCHLQRLAMTIWKLPLVYHIIYLNENTAALFNDVSWAPTDLELRNHALKQISEGGV